MNRPLHGDFLTPFQCSICYEVFDRHNFIPVSFSCGHSCCLKDAEQLEQCHICRGRIPSPENLNPDFCLRDGAVLFREYIARNTLGTLHPNRSQPTRSVAVSEIITFPSGIQRNVIIREVLKLRTKEKKWEDFEFVLTSGINLDVYI